MKRLTNLLWILCSLPLCHAAASIPTNEYQAQADTATTVFSSLTPAQEVPEVDYDRPRQYEIAGITFTGIKDQDQSFLLGISGLSLGQIVSIPGDELTNACKRFWEHGLFSDVRILLERTQGTKAYIQIALVQRPRIASIAYTGIKKKEKEELEAQIGFIKGNQITPNMIDRATTYIKRYFSGKGFKNADVTIEQQKDVSNEKQVFVTIHIDKKEKIKVHKIYIDGLTAMKPSKLKRVMKKTNEKGNWRNIFRTKKFIESNYEADKDLILEKFSELGYRDAEIVADSVVKYDDKSVDVYLSLSEGQKYYLRQITWVGNKLYPTQALNNSLHLKRGDVYNQKMLNDRLMADEDAIANEYGNNGYLWSQITPVETNIDGDSVDLEIQIYEGRQATINRVTITGNDRVYENVVRRELYTKPGQLYSREAIMHSMRGLMQMGHFDPEKVSTDFDIIPDQVNGTVDLGYNLTSKGSDQVEFSLGWGQTGVVGRLGLKFTNFSMTNLFHPSRNHRGFLPQGDGQTLSISGQTNADYYQSYSISLYDPWFGGKRPNSFSVSAFYSKQTDVSSLYYNNSYYDNYYNNLYSGYYGYGSYNGYGNSYENYYDPDKSVQMYGVSVGWGKRLSWPDNYFQFMAELSYTRYILKDWAYFPVTNGTCNNLSLTLTLSRNSTANPIFPRDGSEFSFSLQLTPPYSLWDGKDYSKYDRSNQEDYNKMFSWIEYHKWKFKSKTYTPLTGGTRNLVLMTRAEFGFVGHYNSHKKSPFETFMMGGDGMSGYTTYATENIALRGYENNSLTPNSAYYGYAYTRLGLELRFPLMLETNTSIYALGFLEGGNSWTRTRDFNPFDLKRSAGLGLRIFLPMVGLMGIDWGYGFDKVYGSKEYGGSQFHFVLGQEF